MASDVDSHRKFLDLFLSSGFKSLSKLDPFFDDLRNHLENLGREEALLPGLGPDKAKKLLAACVAETSLLSAIYWICCSYALLGHRVDADRRDRILSFTSQCRCNNGAFAPHPAHDQELLSTVSAVQIACLLEEPKILGDLAEVSAYIRALQLPDGSFTPRSGSDVSQGDCRFTFAALCALKLLAQLGDANAENELNLEAAAEWLLQCQNLDGGFGCRPKECESHAGHTFCCLAALRLLGRLNTLPHRGRGRLLRWLAARQVPKSGMNGRPGKRPDTCYTWWTLAAAHLAEPVINCQLGDLFDLTNLESFIHLCKGDKGGIGPHPEDDPDPFHTFFALAGLSLLHAARQSGGDAGDASHGSDLELRRMDATLVLPLDIFQNLDISSG